MRLRLAPANLVRGERAYVLLALAGVTAIAWLYLFIARQDMDMPMAAMDGMSDMAMPFAAPWVFAMWWVMMLGMMLPSAAPMILMYAALQRRKRERDEPFVPTAMFVAGYLLVWGAFSVVATAAQWSLLQSASLSPMLALTSSVWGGVLFILAGIYQLTPFKYVCLSHCRSPFAVRLRAEPLARRVERGTAHGRQPRAVLPRLLLGSYGAAVRGGRDEPRVGSRDRGVRALREITPWRRLGQSNRGRRDGGIRGLAARVARRCCVREPWWRRFPVEIACWQRRCWLAVADQISAHS